MDDNKISLATTRRLPLYYRCLSELNEKGEDKVSSAVLERLLKIDAATVRRDFSYFGQMGRRGYGYDVKILLELFNDVLKQDTAANVAIVGVGNLGHALINFKFHKTGNARIKMAFDVNPEVVGTIQSEVPVYDINEIKQRVREEKIEVAILTVPNSQAQRVTNLLVEAGIKGIMNFTTEIIDVPYNVTIHDVDLSLELQALIYSMDQD
ncbi:redox-sensing transcriptional repressor Rex [Pediococcus pentosaceus]|uniref:redox-sensing transcriptional repressor Rex n=1 Tax=Pediococcus pentosaceus TaxID=1255 RepID=UPI0018FE5E9A|nr:redox-sensing transcriptional repressor Rex [Pediococcus pentosaceus]MBF7121107.1 redox-sensing transcriptional repressor Rex [Pediococcus pentosaceus]